MTIETSTADPAEDTSGRPHRRVILVVRTMLVMLGVAAVVLLGLGLAALILGDGSRASTPATTWLRDVFGNVFGVVAFAIAAALGVPAGIGLWALSGATGEDAVPALGQPARFLLLGAAAGLTGLTAVVLLVATDIAAVVDLGLIGLVAVSSFGLGGAAAFSPHFGRALAAAIALGLIAAATLRVLTTLLSISG